VLGQFAAWRIKRKRLELSTSPLPRGTATAISASTADFESFLEEEGILEEADAFSIKSVADWLSKG
jgi:hypothetical protein